MPHPKHIGGVILTQAIVCSNSGCKHHRPGDTCSSSAKIGTNAKCQSFEKGLTYYFGLTWSALHHKNFIDAVELTPDLKIGMYCVMKAYHLGSTTMEWGTCRMYALKTNSDGPMLKTADILALPIDEQAVSTLEHDFESGRLLGMAENYPHREKAFQPFGWLSPTGTFTEGDFGQHEAAAESIIRKKGFWKEFCSWKTGPGSTCRDYLSRVKGYCLIHNPNGDGGYLVSASKQLTKKQRDFLYSYFMEIGDRIKAEQFISETQS